MAKANHFDKHVPSWSTEVLCFGQLFPYALRVAARETAFFDFGLFIAILLPGFTALLGASYFSPTIRMWLGSVPEQAPTLGGFLYTTIAAIAAGLTVSALRWLILDTLHHCTGLRPPPWDFRRLGQRVAAYEHLIAIHYHYYQAFGGMVIALPWLLISRHWGQQAVSLDVLDVGLVLLAVLFFFGSRDALRKYYARTGQLLAK